MKTKRDTWIEMSIREIWTQCHYAELAHSNINIKSDNVIDVVFSSIHSFLSHSAMVSKMLKADDQKTPPVTIGKILGVGETSIVHKRKFRNSLEHYDEKLKKWIAKYPAGINIGTYNIGSKHMVNGKFLFVSHYDPRSDTYTFVNKDLSLGILLREVSRIKRLADKWVKSMQFGLISPPF